MSSYMLPFFYTEWDDALRRLHHIVKMQKHGQVGLSMNMLTCCTQASVLALVDDTNLNFQRTLSLE